MKILKFALWKKWWVVACAYGISTFDYVMHTSTGIHITLFLLTFIVFMVLWNMTTTNRLE